MTDKSVNQRTHFLTSLRLPGAALVLMVLIAACGQAPTELNPEYSRGDSLRAVSYINGDAGVNADVDANSSCFSPDRYDRQRLSDPASGNPGNRNVHNDACFFKDSYSGGYRNVSTQSHDGGYGGSDEKQDAPASFQSTGVGYISACPDPDGAGPKFARLSADKKLCFQSGYQETGKAGDKEFHARMNNNSTPGTQNVVWCKDDDRNGCSDENVKDRITVEWFR